MTRLRLVRAPEGCVLARLCPSVAIHLRVFTTRTPYKWIIHVCVCLGVQARACSLLLPLPLRQSLCPYTSLCVHVLVLLRVKRL